MKNCKHKKYWEFLFGTYHLYYCLGCGEISSLDYSYEAINELLFSGASFEYKLNVGDSWMKPWDVTGANLE